MNKEKEINEYTFKKQAKKLLREIKNIENVDNILLSESQNILARVYNKKDYNDIKKNFTKQDIKKNKETLPIYTTKDEVSQLLNKLILSDKSILNLSVVNGEPSITLCDCHFMIIDKKMNYNKNNIEKINIEKIKMNKSSNIHDLMRYFFNVKLESRMLDIQQPQYNSFLHDTTDKNMNQKYKKFSPFEKQEKESVIYIYTMPEIESNSFQMFISKKHFSLLEDSIKNGY